MSTNSVGQLADAKRSDANAIFRWSWQGDETVTQVASKEPYASQAAKSATVGYSHWCEPLLLPFEHPRGYKLKHVLSKCERFRRTTLAQDLVITIWRQLQKSLLSSFLVFLRRARLCSSSSALPICLLVGRNLADGDFFNREASNGKTALFATLSVS